MIYLSDSGCTVRRYNGGDALHSVTVLSCLLECRRNAPVPARRNKPQQEPARICMNMGMTTGRGAMALLPGEPALVLSATLPASLLLNRPPPTKPATKTEPLPAHAGIHNGETGAAPGARQRESRSDRPAQQDFLDFTTD
jgi:hypothetical protein